MNAMIWWCLSELVFVFYFQIALLNVRWCHNEWWLTLNDNWWRGGTHLMWFVNCFSFVQLEKIWMHVCEMLELYVLSDSCMLLSFGLAFCMVYVRLDGDGLMSYDGSGDGECNMDMRVGPPTKLEIFCIFYCKIFCTLFK